MKSTAPIAMAAIKYQGLLILGDTHSHADLLLLEMKNLTPSEKTRLYLSALDGFLTSDGVFVDRQEAYELARNHSQIIEPFCDPFLAVTHCGHEPPTLDSGWVMDNYAQPQLELIQTLTSQIPTMKDGEREWADSQIWILKHIAKKKEIIRDQETPSAA